MQEKTFNLNQLDDTNLLALKIAKVIVPDFVITLSGELGAGKTTLTRYILQNLGITGLIKSPTFTIVEPYVTDKALQIYHFDLYRFNDPEEWFDAGFDEYFSNTSICFIEWAEKAHNLIPQIDWQIELLLNGMENKRVLNINAKSKKGEMCLKQLI